jgi:hypothetical protein
MPRADKSRERKIPPWLSGGRPSVFISHSHADKRLAWRLARDLHRKRISAWIDHENLRAGDPLIDALQRVLRAARTLVLLWSRPASKSRYVNAEWQAAYQLKKRIIPCPIDRTAVPPFLLSVIRCDFQESYRSGLRDLLAALGPRAAPRPRAAPAEGILPEPAGEIIEHLMSGQVRVMQALREGGPRPAKAVHQVLDSEMKEALARSAEDADILNLAGYHKKNAYMIKHWRAIQAQEARPDPLLSQAEAFFYRSLAIRPDNASALNGLGSVLLLRRDLDAAEFFVRRAIARANGHYDEAQQDLQTILLLKDEGRGLGRTRHLRKDKDG